MVKGKWFDAVRYTETHQKSETVGQMQGTAGVETTQKKTCGTERGLRAGV